MGEKNPIKLKAPWENIHPRKKEEKRRKKEKEKKGKKKKKKKKKKSRVVGVTHSYPLISTRCCHAVLLGQLEHHNLYAPIWKKGDE